MSTKRVLVIGDIIEDVYERCTFRKMCPDAPGVPAVVRKSVDTRLGGAANVVANLCALNPDVRVSLIGEIDADLGRKLVYTTKNHVELSYTQYTDEMMLSKRRIFNGDEMVLRLDRADHVSTYTAEMVERHLKEYLAENDPDLILLSDYGHGTVNDVALQLLLDRRERLLVDTKMTDLSVFDGSLLCKLNFDEWTRVTEMEPAPEQFFKYMVVTSGPLGAVLMMRRQHSPTQSQTDTLRVRSHDVRAVDVCGCGDTFLAGLAASILQNGDPYTALCFANAAAATVVTQEGTAVASRTEALRLLGLETTESETR